MDLFGLIMVCCAAGCVVVSLLLIVAVLVLRQINLRQYERWLADMQAKVESDSWPRRAMTADNVVQLRAKRRRSRLWRDRR